MNTYPRETLEGVSVALTLDGTTSTTATVAYALVIPGQRPAAFLPMTVSGAEYVFLLNAAAQGVGTFELWLQVTSGSEVVVLENIGLIRIV